MLAPTNDGKMMKWHRDHEDAKSMTRNPYFIDEPTGISFSGGRTSAYMLWKVLEAHDGVLPDCVKVVFANTGKEMPQTLDFVRDCQENWGVDIHWIELVGLDDISGQEGYRKNAKWNRVYARTTYESASRKGEPFNILLREMDAIPNVVARTCTITLKVRGIRQYLESLGYESPWTQLIGIRGDEQRRAVKLHNKRDEGMDCYLPLWLDGVTAKDVGDFWKSQLFDLQLPNNNGVTDWGNCDLCHLKGRSKRLSIIRERPDLADWWIDAEQRKGQQFRPDETSYKQMKIIATDQPSLFDFGDDETIPCFCGD